MKKVAFYIAVLCILLFSHNIISKKIVVRFYKGYNEIMKYINIAIFFFLGMKIVKEVSKHVYKIFKKTSDENTAKLMKSLTEIIGIVILLSIIASFLNISAAASLTLGSFAGMVIGFASQTVLKNAVGGIIIAIIRPVNIGERIGLYDPMKKEKVFGVVREIKLMYIVLESEEGEILIPSAHLLEGAIWKKKE